MHLPTLYSRSVNNHILQWTVWTEGDVVVTEWGRVGKRLAVHRDRQAATNAGRANARDATAQAEFEAQSRWDHKLNRRYFETIQEAETAELLFPTLAHPLYNKRRNARQEMIVTKREVTYPADVQRKLNGLRCFSVHDEKTGVALYSREGVEWTLMEHIRAALVEFGEPGAIYDGEVYKHGVPLQTINGWVKNASDPAVVPLRNSLQYHLYDLPRDPSRERNDWSYRYDSLVDRYTAWVMTRLQCEALPGFDTLPPPHELRNAILRLTHKVFDRPVHVVGYAGEMNLEDVRLRILQAWLESLPLQLVPTFRANTEAEAIALQKSFVLQGYEGAIVRQLGWAYHFSFRTEALIKLKEYIDEEFLIVDILGRERFTSATESHMICDKVVCRNNLTDATFEAVPQGTEEMKAQWWEDRESYIDTRLMVRFFERSEDGIPQGNPVGIAFRLDEDCADEEDDLSMWE